MLIGRVLSEVMKDLKISYKDDYKFLSVEKLSDSALDEIANLIKQVPEVQTQVLGGRGTIRLGKLDTFGQVVIKGYARGGLLGKFLKKYYLKSGEYRPEIEFRFLNKVRALGIPAPKPIAFIVKGGKIYQGWLLMEQVTNCRNLAALAADAPETSHRYLGKVTEYLSLLIENKIIHVDMHPGNVLIDDQGGVHIIDFDKARHFDGAKNDLRDKYILRWRRAVIKYNLPEYLSEYICAGLVRDFGDGQKKIL
jgi:3-deoxy-D-manno-octulosonic acid kinase